MVASLKFQTTLVRSQIVLDGIGFTIIHTSTDGVDIGSVFGSSIPARSVDDDMQRIATAICRPLPAQWRVQTLSSIAAIALRPSRSLSKVPVGRPGFAGSADRMLS
ncbi:hypothetical protein [Bradyrhizobium macuxiense]|uniref:hypothetical protein n=1 Tax=Bradyrhizobium macuxiense TaxID=1755647 RepID=UPI0011BDC6EF|nr:hypothetical protein [Bradyrhizobium macuxiense]